MKSDGNHEIPSDVGDDDDEEEEEEYKSVARNLLEFRRKSNWNFDPSQNEDPHGGEEPSPDGPKEQLSTIQFFEPRFLEIFLSYGKMVFNGKPATCNHLMASCLEHLIPFCCWARESNERCNWIWTTLGENPDLRPVVRNGLAMILVYCLAAEKTSSTPASDMFATLQNTDTGMGIVNKTSLKIYNDPFGYFTFLKLCLSGLIDAGRLPENERQNQPRKMKRLVENKEEVAAFLHIKASLTSTFSLGNNALARDRVQQVLTAWQEQSKNVRSNRFTIALKIFFPNPMSFVPQGFLLSSGDDNNHNAVFLNTTSHFAESFAAAAHAFPGTPPTGGEQAGLVTVPELNPRILQTINNINSLHPENMASGHPVVYVLPAGPMGHHPPPHGPSASSHDEGESLPVTRPTRLSEDHGELSDQGATTLPSEGDHSAHNNSMSLLHPIRVCRFERVGFREWEYSEGRIFDLTDFLQQCPSTLFFVDDSKFSSEELQSGTLKLEEADGSNGFVSLQGELQNRRALVASWPRNEFSQLRALISHWDEQTSNSSLLDFWNQCCKRSNAFPMSPPPKQPREGHGHSASNKRKLSHDENDNARADGGVLVYESVVQVGLVVRENPKLSMKEDCWRLVYPKDLLNSSSKQLSFGQFLSSLFPQLKMTLALCRDWSQIVVKYFVHKDLKGNVSHTPDKPPMGAYQTIGTLDETLGEMMCKCEASQQFYDFVLQ